jgi:hypothetical protein
VMNAGVVPTNMRGELSERTPSEHNQSPDPNAKNAANNFPRCTRQRLSTFLALGVASRTRLCDSLAVFMRPVSCYGLARPDPKPEFLQHTKRLPNRLSAPQIRKRRLPDTMALASRPSRYSLCMISKPSCPSLPPHSLRIYFFSFFPCL